MFLHVRVTTGSDAHSAIHDSTIDLWVTEPKYLIGIKERLFCLPYTKLPFEYENQIILR